MSKEDAREATEAEKAQGKRRSDRAEELEAMRTAFNVIDKLSPRAQLRVLSWLRDALSADLYNEEPPF